MLYIFGLIILSSLAHSDLYTEELIISRLRNNNLLSQFKFVITSSGVDLGPNYSIFPRIIAELITKYSVEELSFSLVQGRWWAKEWGLAPVPNGPTGAHVHAWFSGNESSVDTRWTALINSLNGVFCTALTSIVPILTSSPQLAMRPHGVNVTNRYLRYGALGKETVCTENLTPWKKLLPCKQNGLVTLLNPIKMYESTFHAMGLQLNQICEDINCMWRLELYVNTVFDLHLRNRKLDWHFSELFGRKAVGLCHVAKNSYVMVHINAEGQTLEPNPSEILRTKNISYALYELTINNSLPSFSISAYYNENSEHISRKDEGIISISTSLGGTDQFSGVLVTYLINRGRARKAVFMHQIPWFVQIYYHTISMTCIDIERKIEKPVNVYKRNFVSAISRVRPALIEWEYEMPEYSKCTMEIDFEKAFLRIREYPPDANHGLYVPAAVLTVLDTMELGEWGCGISKVGTKNEYQIMTPNSSIILHSNVVLVALPVPDFSMPFNVICFVTTTISLCFGPIHSFSTKMLIPVNSKPPRSPVVKKFIRFVLIILLLLASYAQYHEISLNEMRRKVEEFLEKMNNLNK